LEALRSSLYDSRWELSTASTTAVACGERATCRSKAAWIVSGCSGPASSVSGSIRRSRLRCQTTAVTPAWTGRWLHVWKRCPRAHISPDCLLPESSGVRSCAASSRSRVQLHSPRNSYFNLHARAVLYTALTRIRRAGSRERIEPRYCSSAI
jgi:hypothetical protein